jgi:hypothetical protein
MRAFGKLRLREFRQKRSLAWPEIGAASWVLRDFRGNCASNTERNAVRSGRNSRSKWPGRRETNGPKFERLEAGQRNKFGLGIVHFTIRRLTAIRVRSEARILSKPSSSNGLGKTPMDITRRRAFGLGATAAIGSAIFGAALTAPERAAAAATLVAQDVAGYQTQPNGDQRCAFCAHFLAPASCQLVQGTIVPNGWCKLFHAKTS